ncbi:hypothetical protein LguiA_013299 [Lonicera macranthoides]
MAWPSLRGYIDDGENLARSMYSHKAFQSFAQDENLLKVLVACFCYQSCRAFMKFAQDKNIVKKL